MAHKRIPQVATEILESSTTHAPADPIKVARDRRANTRSRTTRVRTSAIKVDAGQQDMLNKYFDLDLLTAVKAQRNFKTFVQTAWPILHPARPYIDTWHMDGICEHLEALYRGKIRNLLITVPPGHSKSLLSAVFLPCWGWLDDPTTAFLYLSFAHELSSRDSAKCLTVMRSPWYKKYFGHRFTLTRQSALKITNDQQGYRIATSVEATAAMGERGDILVADDALSIKDGQKSEAKRNAVNKIWDDAFCSRAKDGATLRKLIIQQRIHMDDLAGHVLDQGGWVHLNLPAEYVPEHRCQTYIDKTLFWSDPRTEEGELLFSQLFDEDHLAEERKKPGYSALYQQNPIPEGGGTIKTVWLTSNHYNESPSVIAGRASKVIQSWDTAQKKGARTSFTVGQVWAKLDANFYLLDEIRERMEFVDIIRAIKRLTALWPMCQEKLIEDKSSGSDVISQLQGKIPGIIPVPVNEDGKLDRLDAVSWVFEGGNVRIPREIVEGRVPRRIAWIPAWVEELISAPVGKYMDRVDAATQAIARLIKLSASLYATPIGVGSTSSWAGGGGGSDRLGWGEVR